MRSERRNRMRVMAGQKGEEKIKRETQVRGIK